MKEAIEKLKEAKSIAILPHINEDGDAMGSCLAAANMLRSMGKEAVVYVSGEIEHRLSFLGQDYVIYNPSQVKAHDLCLCIDCADIKRLGERSKLLEKIGNSVNIDHHYTNTMYADANYVEGNASSAGEVIYKLFEAMGVKPDKASAAYLYAAISSDTGSFKFNSVTPHTMRIAADLLEYGIEHDTIARALFDTATIEEVMLKADITKSIESFGDGKVRMIFLEGGLLEKYGIDEKNSPEIVDIVRGIEGTVIAAALKKTPDEVRVNLRSNTDADVSVIAAKFGGGGHKRAAGFRVKNAEIEDVKQKLADYCIMEI